MGEIRLVHLGKWRIAERFPASAYGLRGEGVKFVWADPETTNYLGDVGQERGVADLPPEPPTASPDTAPVVSGDQRQQSSPLEDGS